MDSVGEKINKVDSLLQRFSERRKTSLWKPEIAWVISREPGDASRARKQYYTKQEFLKTQIDQMKTTTSHNSPKTKYIIWIGKSPAKLNSTFKDPKVKSQCPSVLLGNPTTCAQSWH